jgi:tetratricopeptide (TPR) repeat protein
VNAEPSLEDIAALARQGRYADAERALRERLRAQPEEHEAMTELGRLLLRAGRIPEAVVQLERASALAPDRADYLILLGAAQWQNGRPEAAKQSFEAAIRLDPNAAPAYTALARLAMAEGDRREAELNVRLALRAKPDFPDALLLSGVLASERGEHDEALRLLGGLLASQPGLVPAQLAYGEALLRKGTLAFAEQAFRRALELAPGHPAARHGLARTLLAAGRPEEIPALYAGEGPRDRAEAETLARALLALGRFEAAAALLEPLHRERPGGFASEGLAAALIELARFDEAQAVLQGWHDAAPTDRAMYTTLVELERRRGNPAGMRSALQYWLSIDPTDREAEDELLRLLETEDPAGAEERLRDALERRPGDPFLLLLEGRLLLASKRAAEAEGKLLPLLDGETFRQPDAAVALHRALGACRHALGRRTEAAAHWFAAHRLGGREPLLPALGALECLPEPALAEPLPAAEDGLAPLFVAFAPGIALEQVLAVLADLGIPGHLDRLSAFPPDDGLPHFPEGEDPVALAGRFAARYSLRRTGGERLFADLLPVLDARWLPVIGSALPRARFLILLRQDPRDAFLSWLAAGEAPHPPLLDDHLAAVWLYQALAHLERAARFPNAWRLDLDQVLAAGAYPEALASWLGLDAQPQPIRLAAAVRPLAGLPRWLPGGAFGEYRAPLASAFSILDPESPD